MEKLFKKMAKSLNPFQRNAIDATGPRYVNCTFCGSDKYKKVYTKVVRCEECGYVFTNPQLSEKELEEYYSGDYIKASVETPPSAQDIHKEPYRHSLNRKRELGFVVRYRPNGRLLDIGCAWGGLLYLARQMGFDAYGVEIAGPNVEFAKRELGLNVVRGQLKEACFKKHFFDAIIAVHMLEHAPNPKEVLKEIFRILKKDGIFVGIVPNVDSFLLEKLGENWIWLTPDDHYSHFGSDFMRRELEAIGFKCEFSSEEGHYGEETIRKFVSQAEMEALNRKLRGSELIFVCQKR